MRTSHTAFAIVLSAALAFVAAVLGGARAADSPATTAGVGLAPGSSLWLNGTSNVHDFEAKSTDVKLEMKRDPAAPNPTDAAGVAALIRASQVRGIEVEVPVTSLHSGKSGLDKNMYKALRADKHAEIEFHMNSYKLGEAKGDTVPIQATGTLQIAGKTRPVDLAAKAWPSSKGVVLEGAEPLLMTDYDVKPPTMMLGAMRVNDHVTVHYRLLLAPAGGVASK